MPKTIDAHHHLWRYNPEEFDWLKGPLVPLCRDFLVQDLFDAMATAAIDEAIAVQARQTIGEILWLLELAMQTPRWQASWDGRRSSRLNPLGPMRLMAGSDRPVCLAGITYDRWFRILRDFFSADTNLEKEAIFGENATKIYSLA